MVRFDADFGWELSVPVGQVEMGVASSHVGLFPDGTGLGVWQSFPDEEIWAMEFR